MVDFSTGKMVLTTMSLFSYSGNIMKCGYFISETMAYYVMDATTIIGSIQSSFTYTIGTIMSIGST